MGDNDGEEAERAAEFKLESAEAPWTAVASGGPPSFILSLHSQCVCGVCVHRVVGDMILVGDGAPEAD